MEKRRVVCAKERDVEWLTVALPPSFPPPPPLPAAASHSPSRQGARRGRELSSVEGGHTHAHTLLGGGDGENGGEDGGENGGEGCGAAVIIKKNTKDNELKEMRKSSMQGEFLIEKPKKVFDLTLCILKKGKNTLTKSLLWPHHLRPPLGYGQKEGAKEVLRKWSATFRVELP